MQLLFESIPGSNAFSSWLKNLVSNLAVFPVGAIMFMLSAVFTHFANNATASNTGDAARIWTPPYVGLANNRSVHRSARFNIGLRVSIRKSPDLSKRLYKQNRLLVVERVVEQVPPCSGCHLRYYLRSFIPQEVVNKYFRRRKSLVRVLGEDLPPPPPPPYLLCQDLHQPLLYP